MTIFQECWEIIKEDLAAIFSEVHSKGKISRGTNSIFICHIPNKSSTIHLSDFHPISLLTSLYNIIVKVPIQQIKGGQVLHEVTNGNQFAFIKYRNIWDSILLANECVEGRTE